MPTSQYGKYILISRPRYDEQLKAWLAYASVSWNDDKFHYHQVKDFGTSFQTEEEALVFGYDAARTWIETNELASKPLT